MFSYRTGGAASLEALQWRLGCNDKAYAVASKTRLPTFKELLDLFVTLIVNTLLRPNKYFDKNMDAYHVERWMLFQGTRKFNIRNRVLAMKNSRSSKYTKPCWEKLVVNVTDRIPRVFEKERRKMIKAIHGIFVSK